MSNPRRSNGDDYPAAALKHLQDAEVLLKSRRFDGAAYLSGYVVECALKALIQVESGRRVRRSHKPTEVRRSHELTGLLDELDVLAVQATTRTGRLYVRVAAVLRTADVLRWQPPMRYRGPEVTSSEADAWLRNAREAYDLIVGDLILEGAI